MGQTCTIRRWSTKLDSTSFWDCGRIGSSGDVGGMTGPAAQMFAFITTRDHSLMRRVHESGPRPMGAAVDDLCHPRWRRLAVVFPGDFVGCAWRQSPVLRLGRGRLGILLGIGLFLFLKRLTGRRRPCHVEPHCWSTLLPPDQFSFPSGHTITAFAWVVSIAQFYPDLAVGLYFCALSIAISRVILGMHFLSDVVAGAVLGSALGYSALFIVR